MAVWFASMRPLTCSAEGLRFSNAGSGRSELRDHNGWMTCCPSELLELVKASSYQRASLLRSDGAALRNGRGGGGRLWKDTLAGDFLPTR